MLLRRGSHGSDVMAWQTALVDAGYPEVGKADGIFGKDTEDVTEAFQDDVGLRADGVVGGNTLTAMNVKLKALGKPLFAIQKPAAPVLTDVTTMRSVTSPADYAVVNGHRRPGYNTNTFREDVATHYQQWLVAVHERGGIITSSGSVRALTSGVGEGKGQKARAKSSWHYLKIALDLSLSSGMQSPDDPYLIEYNKETERFQIWCRSTAQHPDVHVRTIQAMIAHDGRSIEHVEVTASVFDFTALAKQFGFVGIKPKSKFWTAFRYDYAEWWHHQDESVLTEGTTFGQELLRVYSKDTCEDFQYWKDVKGMVYGVDW